MKYNEELAKEYDHTYFTEQRQGIRIKFSNEKYWDINLLLQDGKYRLQYAALAGKDSVFTSYKNIYYMTEEEIAMYKGKDGVKLKVLRDGKYANLYLNDKLISIEVLEDEYAKCSAQVGFEAWTANRVVEEYKYQISTDTKGIITNTLFRTSAGWDISGQFDGYLSMPTGGNGNISFVDQYANINLALKVRDYQNSKDKEGVNPRTDVLFVFENGAHISFGITTFNNGAVAIQSVNNGADDGKQICKRFKDWGHMKDDEKAQYLAEGIDFRVVRYGTDILLYIGDRFVKVADLTDNNSGVTADMKATVSIRHWDDTGVNVIIPFELTTDVNPIKITSVESTYGKVVGDRNTYFVGDKITLSGKGKEGYYCTSMKVNGKEVSMNYDGTYTFTATEKNYTLEGTFDKQVFVYNSNWNLLKQNEGVVSLPNGGKGAKDTSGTKSWLQFDGQYTDIDLTLKVRDYHKDKHADERTDVLFIFENGAHISFGITTFKNGAVAIQTFNKSAADDGNEIYKTWNDFGQMTNEEKAQYQADGIDFRIVRYDTDVYLYIGGRLVNIADLTNKDRGVTADMKADVYIRHWGDAGVQVDIPFTVSDTVDNVSGTRVFPHPIQKLSYPEKVVTYEVTDVDLTLQVKRHTTIKPSEKFDILLDFDNGKNLSFYLGAETYEGKSQWCIATLNRSGDNTGAIYNRGTIWGALSTTEDSTFKNDQYIDFRVVRDGTDVLLYIGDRYLGTADLTNNNSGINENTTMKVTIRHYGQPQDNATEEVQVDVPFELTKKLEHVTITSNACEHGRVVADREKYFLGDTVTLFGEGDEGYSCVAMKVNGEDVAMNSDGTYTFTATEKSYTVEGIFERRLFVPNSSWDLSKADEGVVSLPAGTTADWLQLSNQYTNIDITVTAKDDKNDPKAARTDIFFVFDVNGTKRNLSFGITRNGAGVYRINSDTNADSTLYGQPIRNEYTIYGNGELLSDEITSYHADGVELRAVRYGLYIYLYVGDRLVDAVDLTTDSSSRATSVTAETRATVYIRHTNDTSVERVIPFTVSDRVTHVIGKQEFSHPKGQLTYPEKAIAHAVTDVDLTLKVKRHTAVKPSEKFDILLDFGNGKNLSFYLGALTYEGKSQWCIANLNRSGNNTGAIYNRDTIWGALSTTEDSAFKNNQYIDFRIVRDGTDVLIYIGDRHIGTADLTNNNSGINENTTMKVTIRHYGQPQDSATGTVNIDVPFELKTEPDNVETTSLLRNILALFSRKRRLL